MDTGSIRHWPRIPREELAKIFPNGRTVHIPADGNPLPGYALALADVERQGHVRTSLEQARAAGVITSTQEARRNIRSSAACSRVCSEPARMTTSAARSRPAPCARADVVASLTPLPKRVATQRIVPLPAARPKPVSVAAAVAAAIPIPAPAQRTYVTASLPDMPPACAAA